MWGTTSRSSKCLKEHVPFGGGGPPPGPQGVWRDVYGTAYVHTYLYIYIYIYMYIFICIYIIYNHMSKASGVYFRSPDPPMGGLGAFWTVWT